MQFKHVIGQQALKAELIAMASSGRLSHAQMLLGPLGHGGLPLALAYAQYLNCERPEAEDSCGECSSCVKSQKFIHPDIHFSYPFLKKEKERKLIATDYIVEWRIALSKNPYLNLSQWMDEIDAENKQPLITVGECHDILRRLNLKTFESPYKVMIIWLPEYLKDAGNVLLKVLEEPANNTVFLLVAENQEMLLNTILSRVQIIKVKKIGQPALQQAIRATYDITEDELRRVTGIASGNFNAAQTLLSNSINENINLFQQWLSYVAKMASDNEALIDLNGWIESFATYGRENHKSFFNYALHFLRECLLSKVSGTVSDGLGQQEQKMAERAGSFMSVEAMRQLNDLFNNAHYHIERNANPRILMMNLSISASKLLMGKGREKRIGTNLTTAIK